MALLKDLVLCHFPVIRSQMITTYRDPIRCEVLAKHITDFETDGFDFADLGRETTEQLSHGKFGHVHQHLVRARKLKDRL